MIDTHAHIYADQFTDDLLETIDRAKNVGITKILLPNIDTGSIAGLNELVNLDPILFKRMMGLHPCSVLDDYKEQLITIKNELDTKTCVAVGEIGIDLYWDKTRRKEQEEAFLTQCEWAVAAKLPIAIHSRESTDIIIDLIETHYKNKLTGVFHCFVGNSKQANQIVDMGFHLGIGGVITFKNSNLRNDLTQVPMDRVLLETDSPYLAPMPFRGKRNESSYLAEVVKALSSVFNLPENEIIEITTLNALKLFKL
jgi:TatD DNase family protein